jgi:hypothetical protein
MSINYDPEGVPKVPLRLVREARERGFHIVAVVCDEPDAGAGEPGGVTFYAMTPFLPRQGERLHLEDGNVCEVGGVHYRVRTKKDTKVISLLPVVYATLVPRRTPAGRGE